jgi:curved DNA-binding protein CbpA
MPMLRRLLPPLRARAVTAPLASLIGRRRSTALSTTAPASPHEVLGVEPGASEAEIKAAYRKQALKSHPDHGGDPERFERVSAAFRVLTDPQERARHELLVEQRRAVRESALALAATGAAVPALELFLATAAQAADDDVAEVRCGQRVLLACTASKVLQQRRLHVHTSALWRFLLERNGTTAETCNSWFAFCLRHGFTSDAMAACRHSEAAGFEQSDLMRSTLRQIRAYRKKREAEAASARTPQAE